MKKLILFKLIVILYSAVYAGAWNKPVGSGYYSVSFTHLSYNSVFGLDNTTIDLASTINDFTLNSYVEYGVDSFFTFIASVPYKMVSSNGAIDQSLNALGNVDFGLRYNLVKSNYVLSTQLSIKTNNFNGVHFNSGLSTGFAHGGFGLGILYGKGFNKSYLNIEYHYLKMNGGYSDYNRFSTEYGRRIERSSGLNTWIVFVVEGNVSFNNGFFDDGNRELTSLYRNDMGWVSPGLKVSHYVSKELAINFSGFGAFWALHGGKAPTITAGVALDL